MEGVRGWREQEQHEEEWVGAPSQDQSKKGKKLVINEKSDKIKREKTIV